MLRFIVTFLMVFVPYFAFGGGWKAKLVAFKGKVLVSLDGGKSWSPAEPFMELPEGSCVKTFEGSKAALLLSDHSQIRLSAETLFCIEKAGSPPRKIPPVIGINRVLKGRTWFRNKRLGPKPIFETPVLTASIRGTEMAIEVIGGKSRVTVLEGIVRCRNDYGEEVAGRGEVVEAVKGEPPRKEVLLRPEDAVQWLLVTPDVVGPGDYERLPQDWRDRLEASYVSEAPDYVKGLIYAKMAVGELVRGRWRKAYRYAQKALELAPDYSAPHVAMATVLQYRGLFEKALEEARKGYNVDPRSIPAALRLSELLLGLDRVEEARGILEASEREPRVVTFLGFIALMEDRVEEAKALFEEAAGKDPFLSLPHLGLGIAYFRLGYEDKAVEEMEIASLLEPLAAFPHNYLGKALYELEERDQAEDELKRATQLDPLDPTPHFYLATLLADRYRHAEAFMEYKKALNLNNKRFVYRSRLLLDQDRAVRNVSAAQSLAFLGLHRWAKAIGDEAVREDPLNSAAYLFRASESVLGRSVDERSLSDLVKARLLMPVNQNSFATYNEYSSLLELPEVKGMVKGFSGDHGTRSQDVWIRGGNTELAFYVRENYMETDGYVRGTSSNIGGFVAEGKLSAGFRRSFYINLVYNHLREEDPAPLVNGFLDPTPRETRTDNLHFDAGMSWRFAPGSAFLFLLQMDSREADGFVKSRRYVFDTRERFRVLSLEPQFVKYVSRHRFFIGGVFQGGELSQSTSGYGFSSGGDRDYENYSIYVEDRFPLGDLAFAELGVEHVWFRFGYPHRYRWRKFLPKLGLTVKDVLGGNLRLSYIQSIQPYISVGTIKPLDFAGFSSLFGLRTGTKVWQYAAGWDREWGERLFTRFECYRKKYAYPYQGVLGYFEKDTTEKGFNAFLNAILGRRFGLSLGYMYRDFDFDFGDTSRYDNELEARLSFTHPSFVRAELTYWYVDQEPGDSFSVWSFSIEKLFFDKKLGVLFRVENIFDENFWYQPRTAMEASQVPWQERHAYLELRFNF